MPADFLASDIPIFFTDFAQTISLEGVPVLAVVEAMSAASAQSGAVERCDVQVHVRTLDVPSSTATRAGCNLTIDGQNFCIVSADDDLGVTTFRLVRGRGY